MYVLFSLTEQLVINQHICCQEGLCTMELVGITYCQTGLTKSTRPIFYCHTVFMKLSAHGFPENMEQIFIGSSPCKAYCIRSASDLTSVYASSV
jgi:hypothetical protein